MLTGPLRESTSSTGSGSGTGTSAAHSHGSDLHLPPLTLPPLSFDSYDLNTPTRILDTPLALDNNPSPNYTRSPGESDQINPAVTRAVAPSLASAQRTRQITQEREELCPWEAFEDAEEGQPGAGAGLGGRGPIVEDDADTLPPPHSDAPKTRPKSVLGTMGLRRVSAGGIAKRAGTLKGKGKDKDKGESKDKGEGDASREDRARDSDSRLFLLGERGRGKALEKALARETELIAGPPYRADDSKPRIPAGGSRSGAGGMRVRVGASSNSSTAEAHTSHSYAAHTSPSYVIHTSPAYAASTLSLATSLAPSATSGKSPVSPTPLPASPTTLPVSPTTLPTTPTTTPTTPTTPTALPVGGSRSRVRGVPSLPDLLLSAIAMPSTTTYPMAFSYPIGPSTSTSSVYPASTSSTYSATASTSTSSVGLSASTAASTSALTPSMSGSTSMSSTLGVATSASGGPTSGRSRADVVPWEFETAPENSGDGPGVTAEEGDDGTPPRASSSSRSGHGHGAKHGHAHTASRGADMLTRGADIMKRESGSGKRGADSKHSPADLTDILRRPIDAIRSVQSGKREHEVKYREQAKYRDQDLKHRSAQSRDLTPAMARELFSGLSFAPEPAPTYPFMASAPVQTTAGVQNAPAVYKPEPTYAYARPAQEDSYPYTDATQAQSALSVQTRVSGSGSSAGGVTSLGVPTLSSRAPMVRSPGPDSTAQYTSFTAAKKPLAGAPSSVTRRGSPVGRTGSPVKRIGSPSTWLASPVARVASDSPPLRRGGSPPLRVGSSPPLRLGESPPLRVGSSQPMRVGSTPPGITRSTSPVPRKGSPVLRRSSPLARDGGVTSASSGLSLSSGIPLSSGAPSTRSASASPMVRTVAGILRGASRKGGAGSSSPPSSVSPPSVSSTSPSATLDTSLVYMSPSSLAELSSTSLAQLSSTLTMSDADRKTSTGHSSAGLSSAQHYGHPSHPHHPVYAHPPPPARAHAQSDAEYATALVRRRRSTGGPAEHRRAPSGDMLRSGDVYMNSRGDLVNGRGELLLHRSRHDEGIWQEEGFRRMKREESKRGVGREEHTQGLLREGSTMSRDESLRSSTREDNRRRDEGAHTRMWEGLAGGLGLPIHVDDRGRVLHTDAHGRVLSTDERGVLVADGAHGQMLTDIAGLPQGVAASGTGRSASGRSASGGARSARDSRRRPRSADGIEALSDASSDVERFNTTDRKILQELKLGQSAREAEFVTKGLPAQHPQRHHPHSRTQVPYPRSYEREVLDLDVWETMFCEQLCGSVTWHVFDREGDVDGEDEKDTSGIREARMMGAQETASGANSRKELDTEQLGSVMDTAASEKGADTPTPELDQDVLTPPSDLNTAQGGRVSPLKGVFRHAPEPGKVLDLGCGTGTWILNCARTWKSSHFVGLDIVPLQPRTPAELSGRVAWVQANFLEGLPFPNEEFDFVHVKRIALGVPEDQWDTLFEEITRVMKPGAAFEMIEEDLFFPGKQPEDESIADSEEDVLVEEDVQSANDDDEGRSSIESITFADSGEGEVDAADNQKRSHGIRESAPEGAALTPEDEMRKRMPEVDASQDVLHFLDTNLSPATEHSHSSAAGRSRSSTTESQPRPSLADSASSQVTAVPGARHYQQPGSVGGRTIGHRARTLTSSSMPVSVGFGSGSRFVESGMVSLAEVIDGFGAQSPGGLSGESGELGAVVDTRYDPRARSGKSIDLTRAGRARSVDQRPRASLDTTAMSEDIPPNPRDHSVLEHIYNEMHAARFVNLAPLSLLANTLRLHFDDVRSHPPLEFSFPPQPPLEDESSSDESLPDSEDEGQLSQRGSHASKSSLDDGTHILTTKNIVRHDTQLVTFDDSRFISFSGAQRQNLFRFNEVLPKAAVRQRPGRLPNTYLHLDVRSLNLHLALRAAEVRACAEPMWEWVLEYQAKRRAMQRQRSRASLTAFSDIGRHGPDDEVAMLAREDFDELLTRFDMDMRDRCCLKYAVETRLGWPGSAGAPNPERKAFDMACERFDKWREREEAARRARVSMASRRGSLNSALQRSSIARSASRDARSASKDPRLSAAAREPRISGASSVGEEMKNRRQISRIMCVFVGWKAGERT